MTFVELLTTYGVSYRRYGEHHHCTQGRVQLDCPLCSKGTEAFRLGYHLQRGTMSCWTCGSVSAVDVLAEITGEDWQRCRQLLNKVEREGEELDRPRSRGKLVLPRGLVALLPAHIAYLEKRGFDVAELVRLWKIQGIGIASKLAWRIFIPIHLDEEVVSWTTRAIRDERKDDYGHRPLKRYMTAKPEQEKVAAKSLLYAEHLVKNTVVVVEGPLDVWAIGPGAVATLGLEYTQAQVTRIVQFPNRVIAFDAEPNAQKVARELADELSLLPGSTFNVTFSAKDASRAPKKELDKFRAKFRL